MNTVDTSHLRILSMQRADWPHVERIYVEGIATGNATFETESPGWESWDAKHHEHSRLVALDGTQLSRLGRTEPSIGAPSLYRGCRSLDLRRPFGSRQGGGPRSPWGSGDGIRAERNLDVASRNLPGERRQHRFAQGLWVSRGWCSREDWEVKGSLAQRGFARAP